MISDASSAATQYLRLNVMALGLDTQAFVNSPGHRLAFRSTPAVAFGIPIRP